MLFRKAKANDIPSITQYWKELVALNTRANPVIYKLRLNYLQTFKKYLKKQISTRNSLVLVAVDNNEIIGFLMAEIKKLPPIYDIDRELYVSGIFVDENYRKNGIATKLLEEVQNWTIKRKIRQMSLTVKVENPDAEKVYSAFGFRKLNTKMVKSTK